MKNKILLVVILGVLLLGGTGWYLFRSNSSAENVRPRVGALVEAVYGLGTVIAPQTYQVKTAVNQRISEIFVQEGQSVKAGAALIKFDESGIIRAPFDGTVTSIPLKRGELLFPSTPAMTLVNLGDLYLEVSLEQQAVLRVKQGLSAYVSFESIRNEKIRAQVKSVFPRDTQFIVTIVMERFPAGILPGMTADVAIEVGRKEGALSIPVRAIASGKVTLNRDGKRRKESIQIGIVEGDWAEVLSGNIKPEDEILVRAR